jgi:periplasmic divalent cation tolerance protein
METQKHVECAGGIVLYLDQILLIRQNGNSWSLPKGHVDPGETLEIAARREIQEESGVSSLTILKQLPSYQRFRLSLSGGDDLTEEKTMTLFLCETTDPTLASEESQSQAFWIPAIAVGSLLSHAKDRVFYDQQLALVLSHINRPVVCQIACPNVAVAQTLASQWVNGRIAACVQIVPEIRSVYFWEGAVQTAPEVMLLLKTFETHVPALLKSLEKDHPYDVPECVVTQMTTVAPAYLDWMKKEIPQLS